MENKDKLLIDNDLLKLIAETDSLPVYFKKLTTAKRSEDINKTMFIKKYNTFDFQTTPYYKLLSSILTFKK